MQTTTIPPKAPPTLTPEAYARARALRDLTDPAQGPHAMQQLLECVTHALRERWGCAVLEHRADPLVTVADNYDRLHYPPDAAARDARYTRYVTPVTLLRTHTTVMVPPLLRRLARRPLDDVLLVCPGLVYRRDAIDRLHAGEPHQADLWRVRRGRLGTDALRAMAETVVHAELPGATLRIEPAVHPYTTDGLEVLARVDGDWVEVLECGLALPALLAGAGLDPRDWSGLALGLGLDRLLMLVKGIPDIRLLRATDPRIARQMLDLTPYRPVSRQPSAPRDLSIAVAADRTAEELGDRVREALGGEADVVEAVEILSRTPAVQLPAAAAARIGIAADQVNVLLRLVIRHAERTLAADEANRIRDRVYAAVHEGAVAQWAAPRDGG